MTLQENYEGATDCLGMVRDVLEQAGIVMDGCAPMFYDDVIRTLSRVRKEG